MKVCWFSCGVSSFVSCYLAKDIDKIIYTHIKDQHPDSLRFLNDCEKFLGREIEIIKSDRFDGVDDVIEKTKAIAFPRQVSPCTKYLKMQVRKDWEKANPDHHTYIWGYDVNERNRAGMITKTLSDHDHEFNLVENGLTKQECHGIANKIGLKRPVMYDMGYPNNNCIGCVKGGMGYWNKIRVDFPEVFERRANQEREVGASCINGVYLDELEPDRGRNNIGIFEDCTIACQLLTI
jgi:hypothetical protein